MIQSWIRHWLYRPRMEDDHSSITQLVDGDGVFNAFGLDDFAKKVKLDACSVDYAVVSIMGPQSSGKSTLMNHLFRSNFRVMDATEGRSQTTRGIWLAEWVGMKPLTIIMDLEGSDGRERGQETAFEKQAALFALAISDILLINMRDNDIGLENAASKPILRTVFQVMLQSLKGPVRRTTLMFVLRDSEETPYDKQRSTLEKDVLKIWDEVEKHPSHSCTKFEDTFRMEVVRLSHYTHQKDKFMDEVANLRERFRNSIRQGGIAEGSREDVVAAGGFSYCSQQLWKGIKENPDLILPSHMIMISTVRCEEIANNILGKLRQNEDWSNLKRHVESSPVQDFGKKLSTIISTYLKEYDEKVQYLDKKIKKTKREEILFRKALDEFFPAYEIMLNHLRRKEYDNFIAKMEGSNIKEKDDFYHSIYTHIGAVISEFDKESKGYLVVIDKEKGQQNYIAGSIRAGGEYLAKFGKRGGDFLSNLTHIIGIAKEIRMPEEVQRPEEFQRPEEVPRPEEVQRPEENLGAMWDPSKVRSELINEIHLHAIELFYSKGFIDKNAEKEDAEKEFESGWKDWLYRMIGILSPFWDIFQAAFGAS